MCGRIQGHGDGWGFFTAVHCNESLDDFYVQGVSLTHGPSGSRKHIWTFAATVLDGFPYGSDKTCPCSNTNVTWAYTIPAYVGRDYFCDSYAEFITKENKVVKDNTDALWDGHGCSHNSSCCEFNRPPFFCKHLNCTTSDDIEIRFFQSYITLIEIYIK